MNKKKMLMLIIGSILLISIIVGISISGILSPYERQIRLGYKLLEQGNYEEAILAFDKAIDIDIKRDKAYIGKADVYVARCDENALEDIKEVLEIAYNKHYNDSNVVKAFISIAKDLSEKGITNWALDLLNYGYELTGDKRILDAKEKILKTLSEEFMIELSNLFDAKDYETIYSKLISSEAVELIGTNEPGSGYVHIIDGDDNTGKGIGLYSDAGIGDNMIYIPYGMAYFGDFKDEQRKGYGIWLAPINTEGNYLLFEGEWNNDAPNGKGIWRDIKDSIIFEEADGIFVNGFINGSFTFKQPDTQNGGMLVYDQISANMGVLNEIEEGTVAIGKVVGRELGPYESGKAVIEQWHEIFVYGASKK